jgi:hypothetical protein
MNTKLLGPNGKFIDMVKDGGDVKVDGGRKTDLHSVNHDDFSGKQRLADTNPGADKQSKTLHSKEPFTKGRLDGMEQPKGMGLQDGKISSNKSSNEPPRSFVTSREGHPVMRGPGSEGQSGGYSKM